MLKAGLLARTQRPADYVAVAAGVTHQKLSATGAAGNLLYGLVITPAVVACGAVTIRDGGGADIPIFVGGGTTALGDAAPFFLELGIVSRTGGWEISTGASVSVVAVGLFT